VAISTFIVSACGEIARLVERRRAVAQCRIVLGGTMSYFHRWEAQARYMVTVHLDGEVPSDAFQAYLQAHKDGLIRGELVYTSGQASLKPTQRQEIVNYGKSVEGYRAAVLITSTLPRGVATAISWFIDGLKVFGPNDVEAACEYLGMAPRERDWAKLKLQEMIRSRPS
jgi:hypothetical protein